MLPNVIKYDCIGLVSRLVLLAHAVRIPSNASKLIHVCSLSARFLSSALSKQEHAVAKATAAAVSAGERAERAEALVRQREEDAKENSTAVGQWLVTLGIEQQELKGQLAAAVSNR